jgi:hypothetical protein
MQPRAKDGNPRQAAGQELHYVCVERKRLVRFSIVKWLLGAISKKQANAFRVENALDACRRGGRLCGCLSG